MATKNVSTIVQEMAEPIVEKLGYELVEVEYAKKSNGMNLTLFIYKKDGITLDDCEKVSKALDEPLESLDPTKGESYTFNVSSLGIDRPIKNAKDIERNIGTEVEIKLYAPVLKKKVFQGVIVGGNDKEIIFYELNDKDKKEITFKFIDIAKVAPIIKF